MGTPKAAALDNGYFSPTNIAGFEARDIEPYIATGRDRITRVGKSALPSSPHRRLRMPV